MKRNLFYQGSPRLVFGVGLAVSLALVGGGLVMMQVLHLAACPLCILQRMVYMLVGAICIVGLVLARLPVARVALALLAALASGAGVVAAGYQVWLQRFTRGVECTASVPWWEQLVEWAAARVPLLFRPSGLCSEPAWTFLGLSLADWSLMFFIALVLWFLRDAAKSIRRIP